MFILKDKIEMSETPALMTADELREYYCLFYDGGAHRKLDRNNIPKELWLLIPYAEFWSLDEEASRLELLGQASLDVQQNLQDIVLAYQEIWEPWLIGPEADRRSPTLEYVAFSMLVMTSDSVPWRN